MDAPSCRQTTVNIDPTCGNIAQRVWTPHRRPRTQRRTVRLSSPQPRAWPATAGLRLGCANFAAAQRNRPVRCPAPGTRIQRRDGGLFWGFFLGTGRPPSERPAVRASERVCSNSSWTETRPLDAPSCANGSRPAFRCALIRRSTSCDMPMYCNPPCRLQHNREHRPRASFCAHVGLEPGQRPRLPRLQAIELYPDFTRDHLQRLAAQQPQNHVPFPARAPPLPGRQGPRPNRRTPGRSSLAFAPVTITALSPLPMPHPLPTRSGKRPASRRGLR